MGKSTSACFKIISCGSDSIDHEDLQTPESKGSSDRRGWSLGKRSARHRVLSNTVISEAPLSVKKEIPETNAVNFQAQPNLTVPEKTSVIQWTELKTELSAPPNSKLLDTIAARDDDSRADATLDESSIILIQAAIRGCLAQRVLSKQKNIIKLQAAIRGFLVQTHAVGTLRCVQAIVKMQALVRARHARLLVEESGDTEKKSERNGKDDTIPTVLRSKREAKSNGTHSYISIEKLLSNGFARQLMESTPRNKSIHIKCDSAKSDSAWKWLERWTSVSSMSNVEAPESGSAAEQHKKENFGLSDGKWCVFVPLDCSSEPTNSKSGVGASAKASENFDNLITCDANNLDLQACKSISPSSSYPELQNIDKSDLPCDVTGGILVPSDCYPEPTNSKSGVGVSAKASENDDNLITCDENNIDLQACKSNSPSSSYPELQNIDKSDLTYDATKPAPIEMKETDLNLKVEAKSLPDKEETVNEQDMPDLKKFSSEQPETEAKKLSRKASNPAFIAAQSKFEELSTAATSSKLDTVSSHDHAIQSDLDKVSTSTDQPLRSQEIGLAENSISNVVVVQIGGSECGTELSISSTLASPDRLEIGINDIEQVPKNSDATDHSTSRENLGLEANETSSILGTDLSQTNTNQFDKDESVNSATDDCDNSVIAVNSPPPEKKPEVDPSDLQLELGSEASHLVYKSSPEASPRSHTTITESQATPSSQVSIQPKKSRGEKRESNRKNRSLSADKKSLSNPKLDSDSPSSLDQLLKEHKAGKRRNSFASAKPDNADQEPRDSSSSNSLPSYMQATESARAKAIASGSPRSSPDVQEKDIYIKKRDSLPDTNGRQESPRIQRSLSQALHNTKGNGTHSPQDRRWRR